jgi:hypothetical protein
VTHLDRIRRITEAERMLDVVECAGRVEVEDRRDPSEMTDAECVLEWHRLCHMEPIGQPWPELDPAKKAAIEAEVLALLGRPV